MSHETQLYESDFTGLAMAALENRELPIDGEKREYVAGFFNGADGDISVRWKRQNRGEAIKFSSELLEAIDRTTETSRESAVTIEVGRQGASRQPLFRPQLPRLH